MGKPSSKRRMRQALEAVGADAERSEKQWAELEAAAAKHGLSAEEFLAERLTDLKHDDPERYAEIIDMLASSALKAVRMVRQMSAKLPEFEAEVKAMNNSEALHAVRAMRGNIDALLDSNGQIALLCGATTSRA
jgi:hypothetical protein